MRLGVDARSRVRGSLGRARPLLQLRVVRSDDGQPRLARELREHGLRERGAFGGVGPRRELVYEHERAPGRRPQDRDDVRDVRRERREAHRDRLLIADVGEQAVEHGQHRTRRGRPQPRLMQERRDTERLQGDGLPAGVRAADDERAQVAEVEVDRHGRRRVEEWMPRAEQPHLLGRLDGRAVPAAGQGPAGEHDVERSCRLDERRQRVCPRAGRRGEVAEDALGLLALGARGLGLAVAQLDDLERLDEERLPRAGRVVDDPLHAAACARLEREHRPAAALRDEVLLEVVADAPRARQSPQLLDDGVPEAA